MVSLTKLVTDAISRASVESLNYSVEPIKGGVTLSFDIQIGNRTVIPYSIYGIRPGTKYAVWAELKQNIRGVLLTATVKDDGLLYLTVCNYSEAVLPASTEVDFTIAQAF